MRYGNIVAKPFEAEGKNFFEAKPAIPPLTKASTQVQFSRNIYKPRYASVVSCILTSCIMFGFAV